MELYLWREISESTLQKLKMMIDNTETTEIETTEIDLATHNTITEIDQIELREITEKGYQTA